MAGGFAGGGAEARMWELHPCSISGLWAVVCSVCVLSSVCFLFPFWLLSFLSLLPPRRALLRTSCCLVGTVWFSPLFLFVLLKSPAASIALQPPLPPPVSLCRGSASLLFFIFFGVILWVHLLFVDLLYFLIVRHPLPSARRAFSHGSVLRLFTLLWLVSGSQSCSCEAVSVSSMLWLVFRVDYVHKAPQLPGLTPTHPHIQNVKCLVEVVLLWNYFPSGNNLCRRFLINNLMKLRARWWYWGVDKSGQTKNMLGRHSWLCWACKFFHFTQVRRQYSR